MARPLENLMLEANSVFPDGFIIAAYQQGPPGVRSMELLAQFVVSQIRELHDPHSSDRETLSRIATNLEMASGQLAQVTHCFQQLHDTTLS